MLPTWTRLGRWRGKKRGRRFDTLLAELATRDAIRDRIRGELPTLFRFFQADAYLLQRLVNTTHALLKEVRGDPQHGLRLEFDRFVADFLDKLKHSPEYGEKAQALKQELLARAEPREILVEGKHVVPAQAGTQCRSREAAGSPLSRGRRPNCGCRLSRRSPGKHESANRKQGGMMATENTVTDASGEGIVARALHHTLAANPLVGVRRQDIVDSARMLLGKMVRNPGVAARQYLCFVGELRRIAIGRSELAPDAKDKRFADTAWKDNLAYRALAQAYLAWSDALNGFVDEARLDERDAERARFVVSLFVDALAPTNTLAANPEALKKLLDTGGESLMRGLENFVADFARNGGLPAQVDTRKFSVGKNLATSRGSVVYRNPVMELIQYRPLDKQVHKRPLLIAPPQINKFYIFDLEPEKSITQLALKGDLQTFTVSWRNPTRTESHFGLDEYVGALEEAVDVIREITGSEDVNVWGTCSGGITTSAFLAHLAARGERKIHSATIAVCVLDMAMTQNTTAGAFVTPKTIAAAKAASKLAGVVEGQELARMFAWMRPNDLIWNYWVNNYLLGNAPPAFDVLYWNSDTTRLPAKLHSDFLDLMGSNPFVNPGRLHVRGTPLDMGKIDMDSYVIAGINDHITPWQGCYNTAKLYGERSTFVLSNSGHIQSLLNPPGNPKAFYWSGPAHQENAQAWVEQAARLQGSWWPNWLEWIKARSDEVGDARPTLGSRAHRPLCDAPGRYVMEK